LYFSRLVSAAGNEKLSRKNKKLLYSDGRNCPEVFLDFSPMVNIMALKLGNTGHV